MSNFMTQPTMFSSFFYSALIVLYRGILIESLKHLFSTEIKREDYHAIKQT